jgi:hypothetical protein
MMASPERATDFVVRSQGTTWVLRPMNRRASRWLDNNAESEPWQWVGRALVVEWRFGRDLLTAISNDGLTIKNQR